MTLAQVQAAVGVILALIATWTGLVIAVALLLPAQAGKAERALEKASPRCLVTGVLMALLFALLFAVFQMPVPILKLFSGVLLLGLYAVLALGAAGIALLMGKRISEMSGGQNTFSSLMRGSLVFSLAMGFPIIGWLLFVPLALLFSLGAGVAALFPTRQTATPPFVPGNPPDFDIAQRHGAM